MTIGALLEDVRRAAGPEGYRLFSHNHAQLGILHHDCANITAALTTFFSNQCILIITTILPDEIPHTVADGLRYYFSQRFFWVPPLIHASNNAHIEPAETLFVFDSNEAPQLLPQRNESGKLVFEPVLIEDVLPAAQTDPKRYCVVDLAQTSWNAIDFEQCNNMIVGVVDPSVRLALGLSAATNSTAIYFVNTPPASSLYLRFALSGLPVPLPTTDPIEIRDIFGLFAGVSGHSDDCSANTDFRSQQTLICKDHRQWLQSIHSCLNKDYLSVSFEARLKSRDPLPSDSAVPENWLELFHAVFTQLPPADLFDYHDLMLKGHALDTRFPESIIGGPHNLRFYTQILCMEQELTEVHSLYPLLKTIRQRVAPEYATLITRIGNLPNKHALFNRHVERFPWFIEAAETGTQRLYARNGRSMPNQFAALARAITVGSLPQTPHCSSEQLVACCERLLKSDSSQDTYIEKLPYFQPLVQFRKHGFTASLHTCMESLYAANPGFKDAYAAIVANLPPDRELNTMLLGYECDLALQRLSNAGYKNYLVLLGYAGEWEKGEQLCSDGNRQLASSINPYQLFARGLVNNAQQVLTTADAVERALGVVAQATALAGSEPEIQFCEAALQILNQHYSVARDIALELPENFLHYSFYLARNLFEHGASEPALEILRHKSPEQCRKQADYVQYLCLAAFEPSIPVLSTYKWLFQNDPFVFMRPGQLPALMSAHRKVLEYYSALLEADTELLNLLGTIPGPAE